MKKRILILSVLVAILFACSSDSMVNDDINLSNQNEEVNSMSEKKAVERPFKIKKSTGDFIFFPGNNDACPVVLNADGEGTVTHLGLSTMFEEWCWNGELHDLGTRTLTLTAANGDELYAEAKTIVWTSPFTFEEEFNFTGGTGRFENVEIDEECDDEIDCEYDFKQFIEIAFEGDFNGTYTMSAEGTITY